MWNKTVADKLPEMHNSDPIVQMYLLIHLQYNLCKVLISIGAS